MPSIVHRSALMQSRKLALTSQDFVEQGNGLVQVSLGYTAAASDVASVLPLFRVDSQPPISPSMISLNGLQSQKLYMTNFSSSQANGLLEITASYVGASLSALRKPLIFDSVERRSFYITVPAYRSYSLQFTYDYTPEPVPRLVSASTYNVTDIYVIDAYLRSEEHQVTMIVNEAIDYPEPPVISTNERAGLIMGATFQRRNIRGTFDPNQYSTTGMALGPAYSQYGDQQLPGYALRSMTALQILEAFAGASTFKTNAGFTVTNSTKLEHVTPTVRLISNIYDLQINTGSIYGKYGATIA